MANVFEIKVKIDRESDLYEPLNPEKELNQDITAYMERQIADRNIGEKVLIHIISQESVKLQRSGSWKALPIRSGNGF